MGAILQHLILSFFLLFLSVLSVSLFLCGYPVTYNQILSSINIMLCPIKVNINTIELIVHTSCYCVLDLLCVTLCYSVLLCFSLFISQIFPKFFLYFFLSVILSMSLFLLLIYLSHSQSFFTVLI